MAQKIQLLNHKNSSRNVGSSDNQNQGIYGILSVDKNFQGFPKQLGPNLITMKKKGTKKVQSTSTASCLCNSLTSILLFVVVMQSVIC